MVINFLGYIWQWCPNSARWPAPDLSYGTRYNARDLRAFKEGLRLDERSVFCLYLAKNTANFQERLFFLHLHLARFKCSKVSEVPWLRAM